MKPDLRSQTHGFESVGFCRLRVVPAVVAALVVGGLLRIAYSPTAASEGVGPGADNIVQNPGFEEGWKDHAPMGWTFETRVRERGTVSRERERKHSGRYAVKLEPNAKNAGAIHPLAIGQGFPADRFRGQRMYISGWLAAKGQAVANLGLYAIRSDGHITAGKSLTASSTGRDPVFHEGFLDVPSAAESAFLLILRCAAQGTAGAVYFDDVTVLPWQGQAPAEPIPSPAADADGSPGGSPSHGQAKRKGQPLEAHINVSANDEIRRIPRTLYGTNIEWIYDGYGLWDRARGRLVPEVVRLTRELKTSPLRFPGGVFSDHYHWRDGLGPAGLRKTTAHFADGPSSRHSFGTDQALAFADAVGGELLITVNAGTGTAAEAAAWVRYVNAPESGASGGPRVRYWEVGNELYGKGDNKASRKVAMTPGQYAKRFLEFSRAMRQVDGRIKIGGIGGASSGRYVATTDPTWNRVVLSQAGAEMDFLAVHNAYYPMPIWPAERDVRRIYTAMLAAPVLVRRNLELLDAQIGSLVPKGGRQPALAVTEWGPYFHAVPDSPLVDHVKTLGSALYVAGVLKVFIECPRMEIANSFKLLDNAFMGWIGKRDGQHLAKAPYYALQMYTAHFGSVLIRSSTRCPTYDSPAMGIMEGVDRVPYLDVVAGKSDDGKTLYVMAINKHFDRPIRATIELAGFEPARRGVAWTLTGSAVDANTGTQLPRVPGLRWARQASLESNGRFHDGGPEEVTLSWARIDDVRKRFDYSFGPLSVTSLEIRAAR
ncbi:MAG: alpha-L-arabinofuranosidase C-terminal domain-containing protein [Phycisphaerae bacterium]